MKTTTEVTTRPEAGKEGIVTKLTINWDNMTKDDITALAQQALVVKLQSAWRKNGIPEGDLEVDAADYRVGIRAPRKPADIAALIAKLSPDEVKALLAKLQA